MGKRERVALLNLSSWCLVMVERLFLAVPWGCLRFVIVVFPDRTHLLFLTLNKYMIPKKVQFSGEQNIPNTFVLQKSKFKFLNPQKLAKPMYT